MKWSQQIGGVTVTFMVGHVNELRGSERHAVAQGVVADTATPTPHDWFASIPSFAADWPKGVIAPFHSSEIDRD